MTHELYNASYDEIEGTGYERYDRYEQSRPTQRLITAGDENGSVHPWWFSEDSMAALGRRLGSASTPSASEGSTALTVHRFGSSREASQ